MEKELLLKAVDERPPPRSIGWLVLAVLNLLNELAAAAWALMMLLSSPDSTYYTSYYTLGTFQAISAVGMIGVGVCLIAHRKSALACAVITMVLTLIAAGIGVPWAVSESPGLGGAMVALTGWIGIGILAVIPAVTLIALFVAFLGERKPEQWPGLTHLWPSLVKGRI